MFPDTEKWHNIEWLTLPASNEDVQEIPTGLINKDLFEVKELAGTFTPDEIVKGITPEQLTSRVPQEVLFAKLYARLTPERLAEESRVVLASVNPVPSHIASLEMKQINQEMDPRALGLMDYMYFSVYTITTTGYGDIVPTTAYAKFVTSLANFCEVLFLVVFFNALISLKNPLIPNAAEVNPSVSAPPSDAEVMTADGDAKMNVLKGPFAR
jgi:voltage-gated potassium channel Kch